MAPRVEPQCGRARRLIDIEDLGLYRRASTLAGQPSVQPATVALDARFQRWIEEDLKPPGRGEAAPSDLTICFERRDQREDRQDAVSGEQFGEEESAGELLAAIVPREAELRGSRVRNSSPSRISLSTHRLASAAEVLAAKVDLPALG